MSQIEIDFTAPPTVSLLQAKVDRWLLANADEIHSFEGEFTEEGWADGTLRGWLPGYNHGVYIVGEYICSTTDCEGCGVTAFGYRSCTPRMKIGRASDMYTRLAALKSSTSHSLEVLALMPFKNPNKAEQDLHKLLAAQRIKNGRKTEWFWHCEEIESLIAEVVSYGAEYGR